VYYSSKVVLDILCSLTMSLVKFTIGGQEHDLKGEGRHDLCYMNETMSGLRVETLVEIDSTHNFVSEWNATTLQGGELKYEASNKGSSF
jgi:hypothetical protein